jgi:two-component system chemotaxis response regulator CheY
VVDDAALVRLYYRSVLEPAGYAISDALNGLEALELLLVSEIHLLIVDINMPVMDGLTFLRLLRQREEEFASVPVLVTSTEVGPQDRLAAEVAGANFYACKPVAPDLLFEVVSLLVGPAHG